VILSLLAVGHAASWAASRDFREGFAAALHACTGYVAVADTSLDKYGRRWPWTTPLLSVLWSGDYVRSVILNRPDLRWGPFDPHEYLPLQACIAYDAAFAAVAPKAAPCG